jgi:DNA-binding response OmpR family regulator
MALPAILIIEDDDAISSGLTRVLESQGYAPRHFASGRPALAAVDESVALVVLDLGLPDMDGIEVCRKLRAARPDLAILILSARDQELDVVAGLDAGADDYLVKPFRLSELLARVRAHIRRGVAATPVAGSEPLRAGAVTVDLAARRAWHSDDELTLRPKEFDLLALLVAEAGRVVTRERIMDEVWDTRWLGSTKTLDTHVLTLRQKLGPGAITTLRSVGYRFEVP